MAPLTSQHSHRSTTKITQKPFKARHLTKNALKDKSKGKIENEKGIRKTPAQQVMSKLDRRNQAKQKRYTKDQQHARVTNVFAGRDGAPRIVAIIPLTADVDPNTAITKLNESVEVIENNTPEAGILRVHIERFKQNVAYLAVKRDLLSVLEACRVADFVVLAISATEEVDEHGELLLRSVEGQGISNVVAVVERLDTVEPAKKRPQVQASLKSFITHFFPTIEKVNSLDSRQECLNVIRSVCSTVPKGIRWREDRSWMLVEDVKWPSGKQAMNGDDPTGEVILTGVVRGKGLKADRLVQVGDWGDFQVEKITAAPLEIRKRVKGEAMAVDSEGPDAILDVPSEDRDDLDELAPEEIAMEDADYAVSLAPTERKGVLLDDHHYFSDEETRLPDNAPKRLPRGTSKYQAAWFLDEMSDDGSDLEEVDEDMFMAEETVEYTLDPADGIEDINMREATEGGPSEYPQSEMFLDPSPEDEAEQIAAYRNSRKEEAEDDLEFPDEVELPPNVLARERLIKYRGLKSLRTSKWETEEDKIYEPNEWRRLLEIADYKNAKNKIMKEANNGGVQPGTRVSVHLRGVPLALEQKYDPTQQHLAMFSLLRHEHKRTSVNYRITLKSDLEAPLRSKGELIMQCGPRRFIINPLFSDAGNTSNDVHKFQRYLHPGRTAIASFIGPLTWGSVPALFFRRNPATLDLELIATGTSLPPSHTRVIAKRIVLTGAPYKIHKRVVTVRYMFFNAEDVAWFKALQLWTRRGRSGFIRESLGTHGYFKAMFDGKINPQDAVAISLYKRVWPRTARVWDGSVEELLAEGKEEQDAPELIEA